MKSTAETIIFAINAAIRLGRSAQRAYAKSLQSKEIILPLPEFDKDPSLRRAQDFFEDKVERTGGKQFLDQVEHLADLHERLRDLRTLRPLSDAEKKDYLDYYQLFLKTLEQDITDELYEDRVTAEEFAALMRIRQFEEGKVPGTKPLQIVMGTVVNIGIDYFNQNPGALNKESATGQVIGQFLEAIDDVDFGDQENLRQQAPKIVPQLFITAAEAVQVLNEAVVADPKVQQFIRHASQGIAKDLFDRMEEVSGNPHAEDEQIKWGQLLLRSTIANAGHYVFDDPKQLFDLNQGATKLVGRTGLIILDNILKDPNQLQLKQGFSRGAMDKVLQAAFATVAEHPELVAGMPEPPADGGPVRPEHLRKIAFSQIVTGVSEALANYSGNRPDYFPELLRLVLEHTAGNLQLLWNEDEENPKHLLVVALQELLGALSTPPSNAQGWKPRLSKSQLLFIANAVLDTVTDNPAWVLPREGKHTVLREAVQAVLKAIERTDPGDRFRTEFVILLIEVSLFAVARSQKLLEKLSWTTDAEEASVLEETLTLLFDHVFHSDTIPPAERTQRIQELLDYFVNIMLARAEGESALVALRFMLAANAIPRVANMAGLAGAGQPSRIGAQTADILLDTALDMLGTYPELVTGNDVLAKIVEELATDLEVTDLRRPDVLAKLTQAVLHHTARNAALILPADDANEPRYLLLMALRQILETLSRPGDENWQLHLSGQEIVWLSENLLDHLVQHPGWLLDKPQGKGNIWSSVLTSLHGGIEQLPKGSRIQPETLHIVLLLGAEGAMTSPRLIERVKWFDDATETVLLAEFFEAVVARVISAEGVDVARLDQLLRFTFAAILNKYPDERALLLLDLVLFQSEFDLLAGWSDEQAQSLVDAGVTLLAQHPELVSDRASFQNLVRGLGERLDAADLPVSALLPEVLRLGMQVAASQAGTLFNIPADDPRSLMVLAVEQTLGVVTQKTEGQRWRPRFGQADLLALFKSILGTVNQNPSWVKDDFVRVVLQSIYASFEEIGVQHPIPTATVRVLIDAAFAAVDKRKQLVLKMVDSTGDTAGQLILSYGLEGLFIKLYREQADTVAGWTLKQTDILHAIIPHFLNRLAAGPTSKEAVDQTLKLVQASIDQLEADLAWTVTDLIEELQTFPTTA